MRTIEFEDIQKFNGNFDAFIVEEEPVDGFVGYSIFIIADGELYVLGERAQFVKEADAIKTARELNLKIEQKFLVFVLSHFEATSRKVFSHTP